MGKTLGAPHSDFFHDCGTEQAQLINQRLAKVAQTYGFAMGVGSQRVANRTSRNCRNLPSPDVAPDILLFANLGVVQLNYGYGVTECRKAVDLLQADGLILHINPLQEMYSTSGRSQLSRFV